MKKRIALVRGHHLSKEETLSYEPLRDNFEFVCFSSNNPWFDHSEIQFPIVTLGSIERMFRFLPANLGNRAFGYLDNLLGAGQWMPRIVKKMERFDLIHTSDYCHLFTYQIARAKRKLQGKLVAIHYDNIPFARENKPLVRQMKDELYQNADGLFAMSERAREALLLEGVPDRKIFVIGNAVDTEKFRPRPEENLVWRRRFGLRPDDIIILFVGRVRASKGIFELIYAAKKLLSDPDIDSSRVKIIIAGRGPASDQVSSLIHRLSLDGRVQMIGYVAHKEIHLLHNMADIFTLPSIPRNYWQEQFGVVLIESMACANPIVATLSGSIPDVVGDSALLVQPNDHLSLYLALKQLVVDSNLRSHYGAKARNRVETQFTMGKIAEKIAKAYNTLFNN